MGGYSVPPHIRTKDSSRTELCLQRRNTKQPCSLIATNGRPSADLSLGPDGDMIGGLFISKWILEVK